MGGEQRPAGSAQIPKESCIKPKGTARGKIEKYKKRTKGIIQILRKHVLGGYTNPPTLCVLLVSKNGQFLNPLLT